MDQLFLLDGLAVGSGGRCCSTIFLPKPGFRFHILVGLLGSFGIRERRLVRTILWFQASNLLGRSGDAVEWCTEVGQVDKREQQTGYPENVHVCEEGNE